MVSDQQKTIDTNKLIAAKMDVPARSAPPEILQQTSGLTDGSTNDDGILHKKTQSTIETYRFFIMFTVAISIFGASTFAVIAGQMTDPADIWKPSAPPLTLTTVRALLAMAWLCFSFSLVVAGYSFSILMLFERNASRRPGDQSMKKWFPIGFVASVLLHLLIAVAFLLLSISLIAYVGLLGWVIVGFCILAVIVAVIILCYEYR
jgi:hypothetical protein